MISLSQQKPFQLPTLGYPIKQYFKITDFYEQKYKFPLEYGISFTCVKMLMCIQINDFYVVQRSLFKMKWVNFENSL